MMAFLPETVLQRFIGQGMPKLTPDTHASPETFFEDLKAIREAGFAVSEQEYEEPINAVAAPIFDQDKRPIASIAIAGPAYRLTRERMMENGPVVFAAAREITGEITTSAVFLSGSGANLPVAKNI